MGAAMTDHGYDPSETRADPWLRRLDTKEARQQATQIEAMITPQGARCSKRQGLHLTGLVRRLCDTLDQAKIELRQTRDYQDLYGALAVDYNGLIGALRSLGIEISQPAGSERWHWSYGGVEGGAAPTVAMAVRDALDEAGVRPAEPGADYAAQRAAAAREEP
jgi:hypothetical protein